jgi:hypothetical protein
VGVGIEDPASRICDARDVTFSFTSDDTSFNVSDSNVTASDKSSATFLRLTSRLAIVRFPSKNAFAIISPMGGGITRMKDSIADEKSWRLKDTIATIGHIMNPNAADMAMPTKLIQGRGMIPIATGSED